jgi:spermidine/putrescine-binding protein
MTWHAKSIATSRRSLLKGLGAAAIGISLAGKKSPAWADEEKKLNFYNWDTYIGETTLQDFKDKSGIDVNMSLFATNDELFAKLRAGNRSRWDQDEFGFGEKVWVSWAGASPIVLQS